MTVRESEFQGSATSGDTRGFYASQMSIAAIIVEGRGGSSLDRAVTEFEVRDVRVQDFAGIGVLVSDASGEWRGGEITGQLGIGLGINRSSVDRAEVDFDSELVEIFDLSVNDGLDDPRSSRTRSRRDAPSRCVSVAIAGGASVYTEDLWVHGIDGIGISQENSRSVHKRLVVADNHGPGVLITGRASIEDAGSVGDDAAPGFEVHGGIVRGH